MRGAGVAAGSRHGSRDRRQRRAQAGLAPLLDPPVEYFKVDAGDGVIVDGYMLKPPASIRRRAIRCSCTSTASRPSQTVDRRWGGSAMLFHRYLASLGYVVVSFDNAGTPAPRGRAWRKVDLRGGRRAVVEAAGAALRSLEQTSRLRRPRPRRRVGLERRRHEHAEPDVPSPGAVQGRAWRSRRCPISGSTTRIYQERYMGLPQENAEGYQRGVGDQLRRGPEGQPADRARLRRRQRALPGHGTAGEPADRARASRSTS